jgi:uracil-DNA glycosylase family 4
MRNQDCNLCPFGIDPPKNVCLLPETIEPHDVMLIAEQPTAGDDAYGIVFCGKGLKNIKAKAESLGMDVYATYAIKCAKNSKDLKPKVKDAKTCGTTYLSKEIELVRPKHIICLGANTFAAVTGKAVGFANLKSNRYFDETLNCYIYATDHHASAMYNVQVKDQLYADLVRFKEWMDAKTVQTFEPPIYVASTLKSLRQMQTLIREAGGIVAVDTETEGLNPYAPSKNVRCIQFCWDTDFGGVFVPLGLAEDDYFTEKNHWHNYWQQGETLEEAVDIIREILMDSRCIWHNGKFDRLWLHQWGNRAFGAPILVPHIYMDTMHVAFLLDELRSLKLKQLITTELGFPTYDIDDKLTKNLDVLIPYAARDTVASLLLADKYAGMLKEQPKLKNLYTKIIRPADGLFTKMELRGWPIDRERVEKCLETITGLLDETLEQMKTYLDQGGYRDLMVDKGLRTYNTAKDTYGPVNASIFSSTQKLAVLLFEVLKLKPSPDKTLALTDGGALSTDKEALFHLKDQEFVSMLFQSRHLAKALSTYAEPMLRAAEGRGRITTSYRLTGTVTGRTASGKERSDSKRTQSSSAEGMNLQNILYTYGLRACIKAQEGWSILECDLSQIEMRIAGMLSGDPLLIKAYKNGWDIHTMRAMRVNKLSQEQWDELPKEKQKDMRQKAKPVNFGYLYGMMARTFQKYALMQYEVSFTIQECQESRDQFFADHAGLPAFYAKQEAECLKFGYVESPTGRRRHLPNITLNPESSRDARNRYYEAVRYAINTPVQGFASDWKLMSMIEVDELLAGFKGKAFLFGEIHDSILLEVRNDALEEVAALVLEVMAHPRILDKLGIEITLPVTADAKAGPSLGETKDLAL